MTRLHLILILLFILVLAGGRWLAVGPEERSEQLVRDGRFEAALPLLESQYQRSSEPSPRLALNLARARMATGDADGGLEIFRSALDHGDTNEQAQAALRASFDFDNYRRALSGNSDLRTIRELAATAALRGDFKQEEFELARLQASGKATVRELMRLASLQSLSGKFSEAAHAIASARDKAPPREKPGFFALELKLLTRDPSVSDSHLLERTNSFIASGDADALTRQLVWNFIKLNRPALSLRLIQDPFVDRDTFSAFVAAKDATGKSSDILTAILNSPNAQTLPEEERDLLLRIAPGDPDLMAKVLAAFSSGRVNLTDEQMVELAYNSMDKAPAQLAAAEAVLKEIAAKNNASHQSAKGLRYLWGPRPGKAALEWVERRIIASPPEDKIEWLLWLISIDQSEAAVRLIRRSPYGSLPGIGTKLTKAAAAERDPAIQKRLLLLIAEYETDSKVLLRAAREAKALHLRDESELLNDKLLEKKPEDGGGLALKGITAAQQGESAQAIGILAELFNTPKAYAALSNHEKVLARYLYASSLEAEEMKGEARIAYETALETMRSINSRDVETTLQAQLLAKVEGTARGIQLLRTQEKRKPLTRSERVLLGKLLTDAGRLDEAEKVLFEESKL